TRPIPQRAVYAALQADLRSIMSGIQTDEQLDDVRLRMAEVGRASQLQEMREQIRDPPAIVRKGRPLTQRLTGVTEGRPRGGGAGIQISVAASEAQARRPNRCSRCRQEGHNRSKCPWETSRLFWCPFV
ncbi:hypothetical protein B0H13DRAFT_1604188, partial [Mycena leptocephala]